MIRQNLTSNTHIDSGCKSMPHKLAAPVQLVKEKPRCCDRVTSTMPLHFATPPGRSATKNSAGQGWPGLGGSGGGEVRGFHPGGIGGS